MQPTEREVGCVEPGMVCRSPAEASPWIAAPPNAVEAKPAKSHPKKPTLVSSRNDYSVLFPKGHSWL